MIFHTRPVFFSSDIESALRFYIDSLEFEEDWRYEEGGRPTVVQLRRGDCEVILSVDPERAGGARVFLSLDEVEGKELFALLDRNGVQSVRGWWGYPVQEVRDPDGNELLFYADGMTE